MSQFGFSSKFFSNLQFLNEKNSAIYCVTFVFILLFTGGFIPLIKATLGGLIIALLLNRFIFNKRTTLPTSTSVIITGCSSGIGGINNAGIGVQGFSEKFDEATVKQVYDVNVFGLISTTNSFLPLLRAFSPVNFGHSLSPRIINISSVMGRFSLGAAGIYASTKYAVEALTHGYRGELAQQGISVVSLEPGSIESKFHGKMTWASKEVKDEPAVNSYYEAAESALKAASDNQSTSPCAIVTDVLEDILHSKNPLPLYVAGRDGHLVAWMLSFTWPDFFDILMKGSYTALSVFKSSDDENDKKSQ